MAASLVMILVLSIAVRRGAVAADYTDDRPVYQFKYHVHDARTLDYKTHEETGEGGSVRGSYSVREPNGDLRVVSYTAGGEGGFRAMVRVRPPAAAAVPEASGESSRLTEESTASDGDSDSPLKIQLVTERRADRARRREQRQSNAEDINRALQP